MARVSFWLLPAEPRRSELATLIGKLAARCGGPVFAPHVTLYSAPIPSGLEVGSLLCEAAGSVPPFELQPTRVAHSRQFTKTLFIEFRVNAELQALHERIRSLSGAPHRNGGADYDLQPHLSVLYADTGDAERESLARSLPVPGAITFDGVDAMISGDRTERRADVEAWRLVGERLLGSGLPR